MKIEFWYRPNGCSYTEACELTDKIFSLPKADQNRIIRKCYKDVGRNWNGEKE